MSDLIATILKSSGKEKQRLLFVLYAFIILLAGGQSYFILIFKKFNYLIDSLLNLSSSILLVAFNLSMALIITKFSFLNIMVIISRSIAYSLVGMLIIASFVGLNAFTMPMAIAMAANAALSLLWAWTASRLRAFIQTPLEEKWITDFYDSDKLINQIATKLTPVIEKAEAFKIVADELKSSIKIKNIDVKFGRQEADYTDITRTKTGLVIPLSSSEGLEGVLIVGQKVSEDPYNEKDLTIFRTIMVQAQAILDRIRPYEKIKLEFEANQKKLYDTERLLARSERIASMASLIQEYNHEIRTPITIMAGKLSALPDDPTAIADFKGLKELLLKQIYRASDIVDTTTRLSQPKERSEVAVDLNGVIEEALKLNLPAGIKLAKELSSPLPEVRGDAEDLKLVFVNLIKNAREAMEDKGEIKIVTKKDDDSVRVDISDTGPGIPKENLEKIFEPFFSTHVTKGRGLGLSTVFRIVREHLGSIEVNSQPGLGAKFTLKFPVS
jgi:signal transduction histidine kinase